MPPVGPSLANEVLVDVVRTVLKHDLAAFDFCRQTTYALALAAFAHDRAALVVVVVTASLVGAPRVVALGLAAAGLTAAAAEPIESTVESSAFDASAASGLGAASAVGGSSASVPTGGGAGLDLLGVGMGLGAGVFALGDGEGAGAGCRSGTCRGSTWSEPWEGDVAGESGGDDIALEVSGMAANNAMAPRACLGIVIMKIDPYWWGKLRPRAHNQWKESNNGPGCWEDLAVYAGQVDVLAEVVRSGLVESRHRGVVVRVDADGEVIWSIDDPSTVVFPRSANKPIQALGMLRAGLPLDGELLAIASASHSGEPFHLEAVREILTLAGLDESALQTPPSYPLDPKVHADYIRARRRTSADLHGLLRQARGDAAHLRHERLAHRHLPRTRITRLQVVITETFTELTQGPPSVIGTDGCGAPLLATSLRPAGPRGRPHRRWSARARPEARLASAMKAHPEYVSGTNRAELALVRAFPDLMAKSGAESVYVVAQPDGEAFAVKIEDGAERPLYAVMNRALELAGLSDPVLIERPQVLGGGLPVGEVRTTF